MSRWNMDSKLDTLVQGRDGPVERKYKYSNKITKKSQIFKCWKNIWLFHLG